ncbi:unnamed protein product [Cuscuta epithymum]|uniref:Uncharacterized protein n=1 Tax=Cuscuta epithymum TaxID=186058 RepID=A0AAV0FVR7_9ASTE|nr:unnamed protein product [Cuscuta epithymum]
MPKFAGPDMIPNCYLAYFLFFLPVFLLVGHPTALMKESNTIEAVVA